MEVSCKIAVKATFQKNFLPIIYQSGMIVLLQGGTMRISLKRRDECAHSVVKRRLRRKLTSKHKLMFKRARIPWPGKRSTDRILVPYAISFDGEANRKTLLKFFKNLREKSLESKSSLILDFCETKVLIAPAMLLFVAEIDRVKRILLNEFHVKIANVKDLRVKQVLIQIGFYELCDQDAPKLKSDLFDESVKHWKYATGVRANEDTNRAFDLIEGQLSPELKKGMWKGISEAVINSVQHAYAAPRGTNGGRMGHARWWMFSQMREGLLTVAVCDLGIGIPRSLPLNWDGGILAKLMEALGGEGQDAKAIRAAMEVGATSTGQTNRGKGLPQIWNAVRAGEDSGISIHSNRGKLSWSSKSNSEFSHQFKDSINGTVIIWTVNAANSEGI